MRRRTLLVGYRAAACLALAALAADPAAAGTGSVISLPPAGTKPTSRLQLQIDTRWLDGSGYRPVRVRVSPLPPGPAPADRTIEVTLRPRGWRTGTVRATATATIELVQGDLFSEVSVPVPHHEGWSSLHVEIREEGRRLRDLSHSVLGIPRHTYYEWTEATPAILFIDSDMPSYEAGLAMRGLRGLAEPGAKRLPDVRSLASLLPLGYWGAYDEPSLDVTKPIEDGEIMRLLRDLPRLEIVPPSDLPDRWIELTCVDIAFISRTDLESLVRDHPKKWAAMRSWLSTGTVLCVTGAGSQYERLGEIETLVGAAGLAGAEGPLRGWTAPNVRDHDLAVHALQSYPQTRGWSPSLMVNMTTPAGQQPPAPPQTPPADPQPFVWRETDQGYLVAISDPQPFPGQGQTWSWLLNSVSSRNWMWYQRHGVSMYRENPDYWKLLIPDVGEAPVTSFLLLISLFVVVIGPINYFLLQRQGRLYLLLITVPAGAAVITFCLLAYALFTDGLGVRVRARSVTEIDQRNGRAVAWSRQTYYAGMAPQGGIAFPLDAAVYPVEFRPQSQYLPTNRRWHTVWGSEQVLAAGFLPSRTTTQLLVAESRQTQSGLAIEPSAPDMLRVTNRLGADVLQLLVRDAAGDFYACNELAAGAAADLPRVQPHEIARPWNSRFAQALPRFPEGFDPYQMENAAQIFPGMGYYWGNIDNSLPDPSFDSSIFEQRLQAVVGQDFRNLKPQSYLALVASSPEVSLGTEKAVEQASLHVVLGRW